MDDFSLKKSQILDRLSLVDVVGEHVALKRAGRRWVGLCPFHNEKTPSFTVNPDLGIFKCFGCGKGGDLFSFVQQRENVDFGEAMRILADRAGVELSTRMHATQSGGIGRSDIARANDWALRYFSANLRHETIGASARAYLATRGVSNEMVERFHIGLAPEGMSLLEAATKAGVPAPLLLAADLIRQAEEGNRRYDTFRNRLIFPIKDATRRVVGFGGRTLGDDRAKYLNTRQNALFDKGRGLYGIDVARDEIVANRRVTLVEGYTDCVAMHQAGYPATVATLGTALTAAQIDLLRRYADELVLLFDSDQAGEAAADRAIEVALPRSMTVRLTRIPDGKDPAEFLNNRGADAFEGVLNGAVDALEFKWSQTCKRFGGDQSDVRRREAVLDFVRIVAQACDTQAVDAIQRGLIINQIAHLLGTDRQDVAQLLRKQRPVRQTLGRAAVVGVDADRPVVTSAIQSVWTTLLEVLLCEPGAATRLPDGLAVDRIADACDRAIAEIVLDLARSGQAFKLADVLARLGTPELTERAAELARRGAQRGNCEATLELALQRIERAHDEEAATASVRRLTGQGDGDSPADTTQVLGDLEAIQRGVAKHRHFAPRLGVRRILDDKNA